MRPGKEHRRFPRFGLGMAVGVSWQDAHGRYQAMQGKGIDICEAGLQVELPQAIEPPATLHLRAEKFGLAASAAVRHCERWGPRCRVGLEFTGGYRWDSQRAGTISPVRQSQP